MFFIISVNILPVYYNKFIRISVLFMYFVAYDGQLISIILQLP